MREEKADEWRVIESLLPAQWRQKALELGAFSRSREIESPGELLRLLLFHAVNDFGSRTTAAVAAASGLADISGEALLKRLSSATPWLGWIASELCREFRSHVTSAPAGVRPRAFDGSCVTSPGGKTTHRIHYSIDLATLSCDWHEVTDSKTAEALERAPVQPGDVILADRYYLRHAGVRFVASAGGAVVVRVRVSAGGMLRRGKTAFDPLTAAKGLRVGEVGEWEVTLVDPRGEEPVRGRLVAVRLPKPVADQNLKRVLRRASKTQKKAGPRAQAGANYVFVFTTLDKSISKESVLELYRARWQIELVFKRLKQLLQLGRLPYKRETTAHGWILAKLVVALLLEKMHRNAMLFSPWGYDLEAALPRSSSEGPS